MHSPIFERKRNSLLSNNPGICNNLALFIKEELLSVNRAVNAGIVNTSRIVISSGETLYFFPFNCERKLPGEGRQQKILTSEFNDFSLTARSKVKCFLVLVDW